MTHKKVGGDQTVKRTWDTLTPYGDNNDKKHLALLNLITNPSN